MRRTQTDEAILSSALELFSRRGYADATVAAIAKGAHVNTLTVFRHFSDKMSLLQATVERFCDISPDFAALDAQLTCRDLHADLAALAGEYFSTVFANIHILRIMMEESNLLREAGRPVWAIPPALRAHFLRWLERIGVSAGAELIEEMFTAFVVRRALEYNKHSSIWELSDELLRDFLAQSEPQLRFLASCVLQPTRA